MSGWHSPSRGGLEQSVDELDLASDAWFFVMDVAAFDGPDCLNAGQGRLRRSQGTETLSVSQEPLQGGMVAFDRIVTPFSVDMADAVEMRVVSVIDLADDAPIGVGLIGAGRDRPVQPDALDSLVEKGLRGLCIAPCSQPEVDHLTVCINRAPQVAPLAADADIGSIGIKVREVPQECSCFQSLWICGAMGQFGAFREVSALIAS